MKLTIPIIALFIVFGLSVFLLTKNHYDKPVQIPTIDSVTVKIDTVYINKPVYITLPAKLDTVVKIINNDTINVTVAKADTLIQQDSSSIKITYFYPPVNSFDIELNIKEKVITQKIETVKYVEVEKPAAWWDKYWIGAGSVITVIVATVLLTK